MDEVYYDGGQISTSSIKGILKSNCWYMNCQKVSCNLCKYRIFALIILLSWQNIKLTSWRQTTFLKIKHQFWFRMTIMCVFIFNDAHSSAISSKSKSNIIESLAIVAWELVEPLTPPTWIWWMLYFIFHTHELNQRITYAPFQF